MNRKNSNILIASAANKKKINLLKNTSIILMFAIITIIIIFIILGIQTENSNKTFFESKNQETVKTKLDIPPYAGVKSERIENLFIMYISDIKPRLEKFSKNKLFGVDATELKDRLDLLFNQSRDNQSDEITLNIEEQITNSNNLLKSIENQIDNIIKEIELSAKTLDIEKFKIGLKNLSELDSDDLKIKYWSTRENQLLQYFDAYNQAIKANAENRAKEELNALKKIIDIDLDIRQFYKPTAINRINQIEELIKENQYQVAITNARKYIEKKDYTAARKSLTDASILISNRHETKELQLLITQRNNETSVNKFISMAEKNISLDLWEDASTNYKKALMVIPDNKKALDGYELSKTILKLKDQLKSTLNDPLKIKDLEILKYLHEILNKAKKFSYQSKSLRQLETNVRILLQKIMIPRSIWLESNNKANIEVKGIGYISPTKGKYIQLNPGEYVFHAECKGHQTKIYKVIVEVDEKTSPLRIICGEPI